MSKEDEKNIGWFDRSNKQIEAAVNHGIAVALSEGVSAGAKVMCAAGVPMKVSTRVLVKQIKRRPEKE